MRHPVTIIKMAVLAGYLVTVTAALPLHHCSTHRSDAVGVAAGGGCSHCVEGCPVRSASDQRASIQLDVVREGHRADDCSVCQVLSQKSLSVIVAAAIGWDEIVSGIPSAKPSPPTLSLRFSRLIRAPPSIA